MPQYNDTKATTPTSNAEVIHEYRIQNDPQYAGYVALQQEDKPLVDTSLDFLGLGLGGRAYGVAEKGLVPGMTYKEGLINAADNILPSAKNLNKFGLGEIRGVGSNLGTKRKTMADINFYNKKNATYRLNRPKADSSNAEEKAWDKYYQEVINYNGNKVIAPEPTPVVSSQYPGLSVGEHNAIQARAYERAQRSDPRFVPSEEFKSQVLAKTGEEDPNRVLNALVEPGEYSPYESMADLERQTGIKNTKDLVTFNGDMGFSTERDQVAAQLINEQNAKRAADMAKVYNKLR